ncbi:hypothetical protein QIS74_09669 [Colletotrichum tabaci]|uniref:Uncharacterized protein n=1 Tax=Colletotrichum tabaci TaxID=1209068 RepID=A0AAV9T530_9PEZI
MERPRGLFDMTDEQVVAYNTERQKRVKEQQAIKGKRWEAEQRATDLKGYLAKKLKQKLAWEAKNKDKVLATAVGQKKEDVSWQPACSHSALMERPRGLSDMTDEQVVACNAERQKRAKQHAAANSKRWIAKERAQDLKGHQAKSLKRRLAWQEKNKEKVLATASGHMASKAHLEQVRLAEGGAPEVNAERQKRVKEHAAANSKRWIAEQRATNLKGYLAERLKSRLAWRQKNKDKALATAFGVRAGTVAPQNHKCTVCEMVRK